MVQVVARKTRRVSKILFYILVAAPLAYILSAVPLSLLLQGERPTTDKSPLSNFKIPKASADVPHGDRGGDDASDGDGDNSSGGSYSGDDDAAPSDSCDCCFAKGTQIEMADGSHKPIEDIALGDMTRGGEVTATMQFKVSPGLMYRYKGVWLTGPHHVHDEGVWREVHHSPHAVPAEDTPEHITYLFACTQNKIYSNGIAFADYFVVNDETPLRVAFRENLMKSRNHIVSHLQLVQATQSLQHDHS